MLGHKSNRILFGILLGCSLSLATAQFIFPGPPGRAQRSLYGPPPGPWTSSGPWSSSPSFELPPRSNHITRDEVLSLLAAWKSIEAKPRPTPAPEPEPEPEAEPEPEPAPPVDEPEPEPEAPAPGPAPPPPPPGPPAGVPLTVSLPAFVPIQLSAMYTAPVPVPGAGLGPLGFGGGGGGAAVAGAAAAGGGGGGGGGAAAAAGAAAAGGGGGGGGLAQARFGRIARPTIGRNGNIRFPVANPRSFASANYVAPRPRFYRTIVAETAGQPMSVDALPPPPFLANPIQFVPTNWAPQ